MLIIPLFLVILASNRVDNSVNEEYRPLIFCHGEEETLPNEQTQQHRTAAAAHAFAGRRAD